VIAQFVIVGLDEGFHVPFGKSAGLDQIIALRQISHYGGGKHTTGSVFIGFVGKWFSFNINRLVVEKQGIHTAFLGSMASFKQNVTTGKMIVKSQLLKFKGIGGD
jgi:hypothetical protein